MPVGIRLTATKQLRGLLGIVGSVARVSVATIDYRSNMAGTFTLERLLFMDKMLIIVLAHNSVKLQACRDAAHAANKAKLEAERTVAPKIAFT